MQVETVIEVKDSRGIRVEIVRVVVELSIEEARAIAYDGFTNFVTIGIVESVDWALSRSR